MSTAEIMATILGIVGAIMIMCAIFFPITLAVGVTFGIVSSSVELIITSSFITMLEVAAGGFLSGSILVGLSDKVVSEEAKRTEEQIQNAYEKFGHKFKKVANELSNLSNNLIVASKDKLELKDLNKPQEKVNIAESAQEEKKLKNSVARDQKTPETKMKSEGKKPQSNHRSKEFEEVLKSLKEKLSVHEAPKNGSNDEKKSSTHHKTNQKFTNKIKIETENKTNKGKRGLD